MAGASLLTLLDDIASMLDDVALMSKVAAHKTAGVLGDDLALNAQQVAGVSAERELPVVWAVAKGSFKNKAILVPLALVISALAPWLVTPLLMIGGLYLCFEGAEKLAEKWLHSEHLAQEEELPDDLDAWEAQKIKGAIRTDFVLSAEIIAISLGVVAASSLTIQAATLVVIAILMTIGVYGLVAGIVKLDDAGLYLMNKPGASQSSQALGRGLLALAPKLMKGLTVIGTIAMFMVGGGILVHGIHAIGELFHQWAQSFSTIALIGPALAYSLPTLLNAVFGVMCGAVAVAVVSLVQKLRHSRNHGEH
ncbi:DUF808 domain-containing protein [Shewanella sp. NIFS-20-20]|uniref:DUF808 domain-containing protein n=1 Tax=Shewanella sp. NIFS-20-20 TaxID=2853806 RepID=UPI001C46BABA|nr:DUF808 domain-containing protein [Shewanella sp. NIFS-20-20]MBV7317372.1 DUF808 domain-containing protein [Shewanella sp. NIFS-20-20]